MRRRLCRQSVALAVAAVLSAVGADPAGARFSAEDPGGARRIRDLELRIRDLSVRVTSLEGDVRRTESATEVTVALGTDVLFAFDRADLSPEAASRIAEVVETFRRRPPKGVVVVEGHTDDVGDDAYNQTLSERRAGTVRDAVVAALGGTAVTFEVRGSGETRPLVPNRRPDGSDDPEGRATNRRVDIRYTVATTP